MKTVKDITIKGLVDTDQYALFKRKLVKLGLTESGVVRDLATTWSELTDDDTAHFFEIQYMSKIQKEVAHINLSSLKIERPKHDQKLPAAARGRSRFHIRL
jgi:hypothetical protein